jgi:hypothetical protein
MRSGLTYALHLYFNYKGVNMTNTFKIIIYIAGIITGFVFGNVLSNRYHHTYSNSASCKGCEKEFNKGYNWGLKDATVDWSQWK